MREFRFTFIGNCDGRRIIDTIAGSLNHTRSNAIRFVLKNTAKEMNQNLSDESQNNTSEDNVIYHTE